MDTTEKIMDHTHPDLKQLESLDKLVKYISNWIECQKSGSREKHKAVQDLDTQIESATKDFLEYRHAAGDAEISSNSPMNIQEVIEKICVEKERGVFNSTTLRRDQRFEMAAYAAVVSLRNTTDQIMDHPRLATSFDPKQIDSLRETADFLLDSMEECSKEARDLDIQIASAALAAEDVLESHLADQIQITSNSPLNLQNVIQEMDSVKLRVEKERGILWNVQPTYPISPAPTRTTNADMVGNDGELFHVLDVLTGNNSSHQIISIVGMGGIGKTTLTRNAFENSLIIHHFDIRCWVTISQSYSVTEILLQLISCLPVLKKANPSESGQEPEDQLGLELYQYLFGRRYLIVLDDIWGVESWDKLKHFFPDNGNGSRIVVTTRLSNVAIQLNSSIVRMDFLDGHKSWELFCKTAFPQEDCPLELEDVGKKIVEKCKGLPLSIVVIGGFLAKSSKSKEKWENVVIDINSILISDDDDDDDGLCLNILSLSYTHLPVHLKPCFVYMGNLEEDERIDVSRLIKLFVAEGFLRPNKIQNLEEIAQDYIKDLIDRNLILVSEWRWNGTAKVCYIHDLVREVCLMEAEKEKFLHVMSFLDVPRGTDTECGRRTVFKRERSKDIGLFDALISRELERLLILHASTLVHNRSAISKTLSEEDIDAMLSEALLQSLILQDGPFPSKYRRLKMLTRVECVEMETIFEQVNSRYLLYEPFGIARALLPSSAFRQWNLQTLIFRGAIGRTVVPPDIWNMRQLRHLDYYRICLPDPPTSDDSVLHNLQTLVDVLNFCFSKDVCKRIPNIKKLHISYDGDFSDERLRIDIGSLIKLQSLKCSFDEEMRDLAVELTFPSSLHKLSLSGCCIHFDNVTAVGLMLPNLQVLNLDLVTGPEWNLVEEAFPSLKSLSVSNSDLIYWTADKSHFPVLEKLSLRSLDVLNGIPLGFGEIPTLGCLVSRLSNASAAISATKILEQQLSLGNEKIQVQVDFQDMEEFNRFKEMVDTTHFPKHNFNCSSDNSLVEMVQLIDKLHRLMLYDSIHVLVRKFDHM